MPHASVKWASFQLQSKLLKSKLNTLRNCYIDDLLRFDIFLRFDICSSLRILVLKTTTCQLQLSNFCFSLVTEIFWHRYPWKLSRLWIWKKIRKFEHPGLIFRCESIFFTWNCFDRQLAVPLILGIFFRLPRLFYIVEKIIFMGRVRCFCHFLCTFVNFPSKM